jgi:hypothetical protein
MHLAIRAVTAKKDFIAISSEPDRDDVGIAIRAYGREPRDARFLQELANSVI